MDTFTPLWSKIVDSSLWHEPMHVRILFVTMLAKKDADHVVRASLFNLSEWANLEQKVTLEALKILSKPDSRSLEPQEFEGRRIEEVFEDGIRMGWLVLKGEFYKRQMGVAVRRFKKTASERERREANRNRGGETIRSMVNQAVKVDPITKEDAKAVRKLRKQAAVEPPAAAPGPPMSIISPSNESSKMDKGVEPDPDEEWCEACNRSKDLCVCVDLDAI